MLGLTPPYALEPFAFTLPALASCAGRAPNQPERDIALGVWMAARLSAGLIAPFNIPPIERATRAERARYWLNNLTLPQPARMALLRVFDATKMYPIIAADALLELSNTVVGYLDSQAQAELNNLISLLRGIVLEPEDALVS